MIEFTLPLWPILIAFVIGGALGGAAITILWWRQVSNFDRARHSVMANEVRQLRERHDDWTNVPRDHFRGSDRWYRLMETLLRRRGDIQ